MAIAAPSPRLSGQVTTLRPVDEQDAAFILEQRLDARIGAFLHATDPSLERQQAWIRQQRLAPDDYYFAICDRETGRIVGVIGLSNIRDSEGELGRYVCVHAPGHALEAALLLQDWALNEIGLDTVYCLFAPENRTPRMAARLQNGTEHPEPVLDSLTGQVMHRWQTNRVRLAEVQPSMQRRLERLIRMSERVAT